MSDLSKYREALAGVLAVATDCMECEATGRAVVAWRGDLPTYGTCPDCAHIADALAPLVAQMLADARAEALREFARKWAEWVAACAPQIRGGAAYRAICEAQEIESAEASGREGERRPHIANRSDGGGFSCSCGHSDPEKCPYEARMP